MFCLLVNGQEINRKLSAKQNTPKRMICLSTKYWVLGIDMQRDEKQIKQHYMKESMSFSWFDKKSTKIEKIDICECLKRINLE